MEIMATELESPSREGTSSDVESIPEEGKGKFYVFEGIDGSGKTTVSRSIFDKISHQSDREILLTAEPTDCWLGDAVRRSYDEDVTPFTEALLFMADRAAHTERIREWVSEGIIVLCDRYNPSTLAYQGAMIMRRIGDEGYEWLKTVSRHIAIRPDITFFFSVSPEQGLKRLHVRDETSKFEKLGYLNEVDSIYKRMVEEEEFFVVDASAPLNDVIEEVFSAIKADLI